MVTMYGFTIVPITGMYTSCLICPFNDLCEEVDTEIIDFILDYWDLPDCEGGRFCTFRKEIVYE